MENLQQLEVHITVTNGCYHAQLLTEMQTTIKCEGSSLSDVLKKLAAQVNKTEKASTLPKKLTYAQRIELAHIHSHGDKGCSYPNKNKTLKSLERRDLVAARWQMPLPGNDYGGFWQYTITDRGIAALERTGQFTGNPSKHSH